MEKKYSKEVMDHFMNPRNVGSIKNPSGKGKIGNSVCGDVMEMTIRVEIRNPKSEIRSKSKIQNSKSKKPYKLQATSYQHIITDAKFRTFGCGAAVATSSIVTDMVKGMSTTEALKITPAKVDKSLGNLPMMKKHCARLAIDALRAAIGDYIKKNNSNSK